MSIHAAAENFGWEKTPVYHQAYTLFGCRHLTLELDIDIEKVSNVKDSSLQGVWLRYSSMKFGLDIEYRVQQANLGLAQCRAEHLDISRYSGLSFHRRNTRARPPAEAFLFSLFPLFANRDIFSSR